MTCLLSTLPVTCRSVFTASDSTTSQNHSLVPVFLGRQRHGVIFRSFLNVPRTEHSWPSSCEKKHCLEVAQCRWVGGLHLELLLVIRPLGMSGSARLLKQPLQFFSNYLRRASSVRFCRPDSWCRWDPESVPTLRKQSSRRDSHINTRMPFRGIDPQKF